jgi:flagellar motor switch protein FliN/FliY
MAEEEPQTDQEATDSPRAETAEHAAEEAMQSVEQAAEAVQAAADDAAAPVELPDFNAGGDGAAQTPAAINLLKDVTLHVKIELGRTQMYVEDVLRLNADSVIELDKAAGDPVDIYVNDRHVARGEVLVLNENFCVRVSEIIGGGGAEE